MRRPPAQKTMYPNTDQKIAYHMAEFAALKSEIAELVKSATTNLQYALLSSGGVFTWLITSKGPTDKEPLLFPVNPKDLEFVWWLPAALSLLFGALSLATVARIKRMGDYLFRLECELAFTGFGWERPFEWRFPSFGVLLGIAWSALILGDIVLARIATHP